MRRSAAQRGPQRGFTIMELMVVMAIIGMLAVVLTMGVKKARNSDLRADTHKVAAALRTAYNLSAQTGKHHRVLFDLESQTFAVQRCEGRFKLRKERQEDLEREAEAAEEAAAAAAAPVAPPPPEALDMLGEIQTAESPEQEAERAAALAGQRIGVARCGPWQNQHGRTDRRSEVQKIQTWNTIEIESIHAQHLEDPVEKGPATINFFPLGWAEKAVVVLADGDGDKFTLLVHSTGRIEYRDGEWKKPEEHMLRDGAGDRVEDEEP